MHQKCVVLQKEIDKLNEIISNNTLMKKAKLGEKELDNIFPKKPVSVELAGHRGVVT